MIQRKQSLFLFLAALLNAGVFYFDLYRMHLVTHSSVNGVDSVVDTLSAIRVADHYPSILIAVVMTLFPLVAIFMYTNRKRQFSMSFVGILANISFITMMLSRVTRLDKLTPPPSGGSYWIGAVLPAVALIFMLLAIMGIRRDDKLVKGMDRLR